MPKGGIQAIFLQIFEVIKRFVAQSQAMARRGLHLCGFIGLGKIEPGTVFALQTGRKILLTRCILPFYPRFSMK
jgi:hypothetical protein